jgi:hypothetical protein
MILDSGRIAISRRIIRGLRMHCRPSARRRTYFFLEHAAATIIPAWKIYHGASDSIGLENLIKRVGDATEKLRKSCRRAGGSHPQVSAKHYIPHEAHNPFRHFTAGD